MNANTSDSRPRKESDTAWGFTKRLLLAGFSTLVQAAVLFISAGSLDWGMAWAFLGVYAVGAISVVVFMESELITERARIKPDAGTWDTMLVGLTKLLNLAMPLVAGLDKRFGWAQPMPITVQFVGLIFVAIGYGLSSWATISNRFFSDVIRIQAERGHKVVSSGPYRVVRHPGYVGMILFSLATSFLLDSLWVLIPAGLTALLIVVRTVTEDRTLRDGLDGYEEYATRVRYRLLPGVW
ncbi:MAG: isoprenylcysteine carboxylmethyltransferase family protein [Chloroflexota bacterium]|nr:isoprenylcysteine carboxylmethyltransferase family protein [Chloroflexota bacterium]